VPATDTQTSPHEFDDPHRQRERTRDRETTMTPDNTQGADRTERAQEPPERRSDAAERFGELFHHIDDAVVETEMGEDGPVIRAVNPAFERVFGYEREAVLGESLNDVIVPEDSSARAREFDHRVAAGKQSSAIVRRQTATGIREFLLRVVPDERDGGSYSFGIYSDITDLRRHERHSRVVHRILRHNLRNDLSVILGLAESLERAEDPSVRESAQLIAEHAERIASLREETRPLEQVLDSGRDVAPRSVERLCRLAVDAVTDDDTPTVTVDVPEGLAALTIPQLQRAIESLVENALAHAGDEPTVEVRARETDGTVHIEVVDDGPGIPDHERGPVFEDRDITQLEHGSGVGLWLTRWTVEACGGDLEYERTADGHTVVRLVLRPAESAAPESLDP
jgi:PAS domain S-box-containing protein